MTVVGPERPRGKTPVSGDRAGLTVPPRYCISPTYRRSRCSATANNTRTTPPAATTMPPDNHANGRSGPLAGLAAPAVASRPERYCKSKGTVNRSIDHLAKLHGAYSPKALPSEVVTTLSHAG